MNPENYANPFV